MLLVGKLDEDGPGRANQDNRRTWDQVDDQALPREWLESEAKIYGFGTAFSGFAERRTRNVDWSA